GGDGGDLAGARQEQVAAAVALAAQLVEGADRAGIGGGDYIGRGEGHGEVAILRCQVKESLQDRRGQQRMIAGSDQQGLREVDALQRGGNAGGRAVGGGDGFQQP